MTEQEWHESCDLKQMLACIHGSKCHWAKKVLVGLGMSKRRLCIRRLRFFACACVRLLPSITNESPGITALALFDQYADGLMSKDQLHVAWATLPMDSALFTSIRDIVRSLFSVDGEEGCLRVASLAGLFMAKAQVGATHYSVDSSRYPIRLGLDQFEEAEKATGQQMLHDIFGRSFIKEWSQAWNTEVRSIKRKQASLLRCVFGNPFRPYPAPPSWPTTVVQLAGALYNGQDCRLPLSDALEECGHPELAEHFRKEEWHMKGCWAMDVVLGKG
jgi:hypothetical protein